VSKRFIALAAAIAVGVLGFSAVSADAAPAPDRVSADAVEPNSVYSASIVDGQIGQVDLYSPLVDYLRAVPNSSVWWSSLNDGIVSVSKLAADTKAEIAKGTAQAASITAPVVVADIGGSIYDPAAGQGATQIAYSDITLLPGKSYQIDYTAQAGWVPGETPVADTQVQIVPWLNVDADDVFKASTADQQNDEIRGAVSATAYMPTPANRHITVSGSVVFTNTTGVAQPLQLGAFGYQDNAGGDASGRVVIQAATLSATLL
jgi:hypothetical protein